MKSLAICLLFFFVTKVSAQQDVHPLNNYPTVSTFQSILFQQLKNYFELLKSKSVIYDFQDQQKLFRYVDPTTNNVGSIRVKIERSVLENQISERVIYSLENGESFSWEYLRKGALLLPTSDSDLLTLKMKPTFKESFFSIKLPEVKQTLIFEKKAEVETSYALIGSFEFNVKIEKWIKDNEPFKINYLLFYAGMPSPQTFLTVTSSVDRTLSHIGKNGVITPKEFFNGINETSGAFIGAAQESKGILLMKGFPKF